MGILRSSFRFVKGRYRHPPEPFQSAALPSDAAKP
jgi:hypothetical protein